MSKVTLSKSNRQLRKEDAEEIAEAFRSLLAYPNSDYPKLVKAFELAWCLGFDRKRQKR